MTEDNKRLVSELSATITAQLRTLGVELCDDARNRMPPGGAEEARVVHVVASNLAMVVAPGLCPVCLADPRELDDGDGSSHPIVVCQTGMALSDACPPADKVA